MTHDTDARTNLQRAADSIDSRLNSTADYVGCLAEAAVEGSSVAVDMRALADGLQALRPRARRHMHPDDVKKTGG